jgi:hypothetical protein
MKAEANISNDHLSSNAICSHLNQQYSSWIHIMALHHYQARYRVTPNLVIENAKIVNISPTTCNLSYTYCNGEICSKEYLSFDFLPHLVDAGESR